MRRSRYRVFVHADRGREESGHEVERGIPRSGRHDGPARVRLGERVEVGTYRSHDVFRLHLDQIVEP